MHKYLKLLVFVLTSMALSRENVYAQEFSVSFNATNVEDKYAINSMPLVLLFKYLDFGYAGCLISFSVTYDENIVINEKTNPNIVAEVGLFDFTSRKIEIIRIFDDINDKYVSVYTNTKCNNIMKISFLKVGCFGGWKNQFSHLSCPYKFKKEEYFVATIYSGSAQIEKSK